MRGIFFRRPVLAVAVLGIIFMAAAAVAPAVVLHSPNYLSETEHHRLCKGEIILININTAGSEQLQSLSGIGEVIAGRIIAYRTEHGGFSSVEELVEVDGISQSMYEKLLYYITV